MGLGTRRCYSCNELLNNTLSGEPTKPVLLLLRSRTALPKKTSRSPSPSRSPRATVKVSESPRDCSLSVKTPWPSLSQILLPLGGFCLATKTSRSPSPSRSPTINMPESMSVIDWPLSVKLPEPSLIQTFLIGPRSMVIVSSTNASRSPSPSKSPRATLEVTSIGV